MVDPASHRVSRVRRYSGTGREASALRVRDSNPLRSAFPCRSAALTLSDSHMSGPATPDRALSSCRFDLLPVRSPLLGESHVDFFSSGYLDVSVLRVVLPRPMRSGAGWQAMTPAGFSHSEIRGSKVMCTSPRLIAACHVLRRLSVPRHPPCALTIFFSRPRAMVARGLEPD